MTDVPTPPPPPPGGSEPWSAASGSTPAPPPSAPPPMAPPAGAQPYAGAGAHQYADFGKRAQAGLIDWFGPNIVAGIVQVAISATLGLLLSLVALAWGLYNAYLNGSTGQSIGKKQVGIRLLKEADGTLIGGGMGIVRALAHIVDGIICYIGFLFPLWDAKRQTLADKIMGTVVVDADGTGPGSAAFRGV